MFQLVKHLINLHKSLCYTLTLFDVDYLNHLLPLNLKFFLETRHTDLRVSDIDGNMVAGIGYFIWRNRRLFREGIGFRVNNVPEDIIDIIHKDE